MLISKQSSSSNFSEKLGRVTEVNATREYPWSVGLVHSDIHCLVLKKITLTGLTQYCWAMCKVIITNPMICQV